MADITFVVTEAAKTGILNAETPPDLDVKLHPNVQLGNAATGDDFLMPNDGKTFLLMVCGAAASAVTFEQVKDKYGRLETTYLTFTPTVSKTSLVGPFLPDLWNQHGGLLRFKPAAGQALDFYLAVRVANPT